MKYKMFLQQSEQLLASEDNLISLLANASACLNMMIPNINWIGFYLFDGKVLRVGPFQGKPACSIIKPEDGVCGAAFSGLKTLVVDDVHQFPGHIACDSASNSEIVIPLITKNGPIGVLDIDSPNYRRFDLDLKTFLESFVALLSKFIDNLASL